MQHAHCTSRDCFHRSLNFCICHCDGCKNAKNQEKLNEFMKELSVLCQKYNFKIGVCDKVQRVVRINF